MRSNGPRVLVVSATLPTLGARLAACGFALAVALGAAGCGSSGASAGGMSPATTARVAEADASPVVPSGASFHATLDAPLSSEHANVGDRFTATLDDPLRGLDGATLVPKGSRLSGHVLEVTRAGIARLVLQFDTVEVRGRAYSLYAQVTRIETARVVQAYSSDATSVAVDVYPMPARPLVAPEVGGGPTPEQLPLLVEAGAGIQLFLSRPLELSPTPTDTP